MIAIPLPFSYGNEQYKNAQKLVDAGLGFILPQSQANCSRLIEVINLFSKLDVDTQKLESVRRQVPEDALNTMVRDIEKILS